jgi:hypothetical protein
MKAIGTMSLTAVCSESSITTHIIYMYTVQAALATATDVHFMSDLVARCEREGD